MTLHRLTVNGEPAEIEADPTTPLLDVLRNALHLTGARYGCGAELCGACMVLVDGDPAYACSRELATVAGRAVTTVEGLRDHKLMDAFLAEQAGQCGYCLTGIIVSAAHLLATTPNPTRAQIVQALEPHLCRCGAHPRIIRAVQRAAAA